MRKKFGNTELIERVAILESNKKLITCVVRDCIIERAMHTIDALGTVKNEVPVSSSADYIIDVIDVIVIGIERLG